MSRTRLGGLLDTVSDDKSDSDDDPGRPLPQASPLVVRHGVGFSPLGTPSERRCSFCNRRSEAVGRLVRGRGAALICDRCVELAAATIENDASTEKIFRIRPTTSAPANRDDAEAAIERAYDLMDVMREVDMRYPTRGQIDVSVDYVRFVDEQEAEVGYTLLFGANAMYGMQKGYAVEDAGAWKMSRATYAELLGRIGVALPPRPSESA